jgi:hypothetical protein
MFMARSVSKVDERSLQQRACPPELRAAPSVCSIFNREVLRFST